MASPLSVGCGRMSASAPGATSSQFADPFQDIASLAFPENIRDALLWCEFITSRNGPYREALNRVMSYFITDVEIVAPSGKRIGRDEKQKYLDFLNDTIGIREVLHEVGLDYLIYGNSFTSLLIPFRRYLACETPGCGLEVPFKKAHNTPELRFTWSAGKFILHCPKCKRTQPWRKVDRRTGEKDAVRLKRWSPHDIEIIHDQRTDDKAFVWKIPEDYRSAIKQGLPFQLERASWEVVTAIYDNENLLFDDDMIYHMAMPAMAGQYMRGWGLSRVLTNFGQAWYYQVLCRFNEAIAMDRVVPFNVLTPMPRPGAGGGAGGDTNDPVLTVNMGGFVARVNAMLRHHKRDPGAWNVLPFPLQYQAIGGDASQLAPKDLLELGLNTLLNAIGVPVELYNASLSLQSAPAALRLFEANWAHLVHKLNRFLCHFCDKLSKIMGWEPVVARLVRVKHADDLNRQMAVLQLMMGGQISKTTGLKAMGLEFIDETRQTLEEERLKAEETQKTQDELDQAAQMDELTQQTAQPPAAQPGQPPQPGAPAGAPPQPGQPAQPGQTAPGSAATQFGATQTPGPNQMVSLTEMQSQATMIAQQMMAMPESQKDSALIQLKRQNETLHLMVKSQLETMRRQAELQGREMVLQQQFGKAARYIKLGPP